MFVTRFAPSPTGLLHLGHAFSALTAFDAARAAGGRFVLRIEDIDATRCRPRFEAAMIEDLAWLGLVWEEPAWRQSRRMAVYQAALDGLRARGLLYRCFRTRKDVGASAPHGPDAPAAGGPPTPAEEAAALAAGKAFAWRLNLERALDAHGPAVDALRAEVDGTLRAIDPRKAGDVVLARKEVPTSYHLACVVDDAAQGISHVIRGLDLADAVDVQVLLQALLGLPTPAYVHHRLILDDQGRRLAKRDGAQGIRALREAGATPADVRAMVGL
jgi:glutamyl-Q tRNA(Asp) synthetase